MVGVGVGRGMGVKVGRGVGVGVGVGIGVDVGTAVAKGAGVGVGIAVDVGTGLGITDGVEVGIGVLVGTGVAVGISPTRLATIASTVAPILGVGSTGVGAAVEQASTRVPMSTARTTGGFIRIPVGWIEIFYPMQLRHKKGRSRGPKFVRGLR